MNFLTVGSKLNKRILKEAMFLERTLGMSSEEAREQAKRMAFSHLKRSFRYSLTQGMPFQDAVYESIKYLENRGDLTSSYQGSLNECQK